MTLRGVPWEDLSVLLAALEHGSLNRAAAVVGTSQSTVSRRLARLEERLGARLFDRTPEGLQPTAFALEVAPYAELVASHMAEIERVAAGQEAEPAGRVRLAVVDGLAPYLVLPGLRALQQRHPRIELDLLAGQAVVDLVRRDADLALRFVSPTTPDLVVRRLATLTVQPFVHPDLAALPLEALPWVSLFDPDELFAETRWLATHARPRHHTRVTSWRDLLSAVEGGVGAGLLSPWVAGASGLVPVPAVANEVAAEHGLLLVYHQALRDVPRIRAVREWLVEQAAGLVAGTEPLLQEPSAGRPK